MTYDAGRLQLLVKKEIDQCIDSLKQGTLTEEDLLRVSETVDCARPRLQDVLFLQASTASPVATVLGMRIIESGEISDGPADPEDWPYATVLDAVRDGWRIIKLPDMALSMDDAQTFGLGYEFVLER